MTVGVTQARADRRHARWRAPRPATPRRRWRPTRRRRGSRRSSSSRRTRWRSASSRRRSPTARARCWCGATSTTACASCARPARRSASTCSTRSTRSGIEGQKTIVLELLQQLGWEPPDWIVVPAGQPRQHRGVREGAARGARVGAHPPRARGSPRCRPRGRRRSPAASREGFASRHRVRGARPSPRRSASATRRPTTARCARSARPTASSLAVTDGEILEAKAVVDAAASAASRPARPAWRACARWCGGGLIDPAEHVVAVLTGHVLKDPGILLQYHRETEPPPPGANRPVEIEPRPGGGRAGAGRTRPVSPRETTAGSPSRSCQFASPAMNSEPSVPTARPLARRAVGLPPIAKVWKSGEGTPVANGTNATRYPDCGSGARFHDPWNATKSPPAVVGPERVAGVEGEREGGPVAGKSTTGTFALGAAPHLPAVSAVLRGEHLLAVLASSSSRASRSRRRRSTGTSSSAGFSALASSLKPQLSPSWSRPWTAAKSVPGAPAAPRSPAGCAARWRTGVRRRSAGPGGRRRTRQMPARRSSSRQGSCPGEPACRSTCWQLLVARSDVDVHRASRAEREALLLVVPVVGQSAHDRLGRAPPARARPDGSRQRTMRSVSAR